MRYGDLNKDKGCDGDKYGRYSINCIAKKEMIVNNLSSLFKLYTKRTIITLF